MKQPTKCNVTENNCSSLTTLKDQFVLVGLPPPVVKADSNKKVQVLDHNMQIQCSQVNTYSSAVKNSPPAASPIQNGSIPVVLCVSQEGPSPSLDVIAGRLMTQTVEKKPKMSYRWRPGKFLSEVLKVIFLLWLRVFLLLFCRRVLSCRSSGGLCDQSDLHISPYQGCRICPHFTFIRSSLFTFSDEGLSVRTHPGFWVGNSLFSAFLPSLVLLYSHGLFPGRSVLCILMVPRKTCMMN